MAAEQLRDSAVRFAGRLRDLITELASSDINAALRIAEGYGDFLHQNFVGIYADSALERELARRLTRLLPAGSSGRLGVTAHLITTAYPWGGHTRVVERLLAAGLGNGLIAVDPLPEEVVTRLPKDKPIIQVGRGDSGEVSISRIVAAGLQFDNIILHINPDDIYSAVAAALLAMAGRKIYFYNHADHVFSFGYGSAEIILEISKYGWLLGTARGVQHRQSFSGTPIPTVALPQCPLGKSKRLVIAGAPGKFVPFLEYNVPDFINKLTRELHESLAISVVGPTGREKYWHALAPDARRFVTFIPSIPHDLYVDLLSCHDAYIDSFPVPNATGFAEVVAGGMPSFGLDLLAGYSFADKLRSHTVSELVAAIATYHSGRSRERFDVEETRQQVIREQSPGACANRICQVITDKSLVPLPADFLAMNCGEEFFERSWLSSGEVNINSWSLVRLRASDLRAIARVMGDFGQYCSPLHLARSAAIVLLGDSGRSTYRRVRQVLTLGRR